MEESSIQEIVDRVLRSLEPTQESMLPQQSSAADTARDLTATDIRTQMLVDHPHDREAFLSMKAHTPARLGVGRAGARYRTQTMLRFAADHAAAQDAVFSDVPDALLAQLGWKHYQTTCDSRDEFLTRPDKGRAFSPDTLAHIKQDTGTPPRVFLYVADGLSSSAVIANAADIVKTVQKGLEGYGVTVSQPIFVQYGRVGSMDALGDAIGSEVFCVFLGERPGLVTAESMSAYIAYRPTVGMPESRRTVLANIHRGGTQAVEAGAHIVDVIRKMLEQKASGLDLTL